MKSEEFTVLNEKMDHMIKYMEDRFVQNDEAHDKLLSHIDYLVGMTQKLDQERLFGFARVNRLEKDVIKIKKHLNLT